ncbi:carboxymuconolactone decarboxylase family protein [Fodinicola feengrottensis]|uniref:Carboxymuconolactone decarboxylase family protein n=1 Tax=Fodinicola feengrottensis TaxID=435914 RepID=A0ABN2HX89_9ACTN|nr:carboxymuconolactone decarboxylase family protein [Fodinicola feengrottensis]
MTREERFAKGQKMLQQLDGEAVQKTIDALADINPELGEQIIGWGFGEMYSRPELPPRDRQLLNLGILTALGGCESQLDGNINTALNVGLTPTEIVEALMHTALYCGFPKSLNATFVAKKVFAERGLLPVKQEG